MTMPLPERFVIEFAQRTLANLNHFYEEPRPLSCPPYEITQLVNSTLGLFIFPKQLVIEKIPTTPLIELERSEWQAIQTGDYIIEEVIKNKEGRTRGARKEANNLRTLIECMRHAFAHATIEYFLDENGRDIGGMWIWNSPSDKNKDVITWAAKLNVNDLRKLCSIFSEVIGETF